MIGRAHAAILFSLSLKKKFFIRRPTELICKSISVHEHNALSTSGMSRERDNNMRNEDVSELGERKALGDFARIKKLSSCGKTRVQLPRNPRFAYLGKRSTSPRERKFPLVCCKNISWQTNLYVSPVHRFDEFDE